MSENNVIYFFEEISKIPRASKKESAISEFLYNFALDRNLEVIRDDFNNIIIRKPASKGYENAPSVILQSHMDMVCEKNNDTKHDFDKEGIKLVFEKDNIRANGTTLGADNGIGMAYSLAILDDKNLQHPKIEVVITADEEMGMTGAMNLSEKILENDILINMDSEEEGHLLVSCAGGTSQKVILDLEYEDTENEFYELQVRGLQGGHSGMEIDKERANSNILMGRILKYLEPKIEFGISKIHGGNKSNAIPRECDTIISIKKEDKDKVQEFIMEIERIIKGEFTTSDKSINIKIVKVEKHFKIMNEENKKSLINLLFLLPNGINSKSVEVENLVVSSCNLGVIKIEDNKVIIDYSIRSSVRSLINLITEKIDLISNLCNAKSRVLDGYPEWQYDKNSFIRTHAEKVYKNMYGKDAKIVAIHAGVECGLFKKKYPQLDMISLGPDIFDVHTPKENVNITSMNRVYEYIIELLKELK